MVTDNGLQDFQRFWETEEPPNLAVRLLKKREGVSRSLRPYFYAESGWSGDRLPAVSRRISITWTLEVASRTPVLQHGGQATREPKFKEKYVEFMREFISMGHLELVPLDSEEPDVTKCFYVPHHGVLKESSTTTKLRVVFDASAKTSSGVSLNDSLLTGPRIQDEIFKILVRFRFYGNRHGWRRRKDVPPDRTS